ncbi:hypothetical protein BLAT2472_50013 [Burkholderia latens]
MRELTTFPEVVTVFFLYGISLHGSVQCMGLRGQISLTRH